MDKRVLTCTVLASKCCPMHGLSLEHQVHERQVEQGTDFVAGPVVAKGGHGDFLKGGGPGNVPDSVRSRMLRQPAGMSMVNYWSFFKRTLTLPSTCLLCQAPASHAQPLCDGCLADLPWNTHACERCALPLPKELLLCGECRPRPPPQQRTVAPLRYVFPVDSLIAGLKYHRQLSHTPLLSQTLLEAIQAADHPLPQRIIPVPLHARRLAERGYNQSLELARPIARALGLPLETRLIQRARHTRAQRTLDAATRQRNLARAFQLDTRRLEQLGHPVHVALVDDVFTTGATVNAIGSLLQRHGVTDIDIWCVARTP
jgi:ComF family protein